MKKWELKIAKGFDTRTQKRVGLFVAQLDEQLASLKPHVKNLTVKQLQWQLKPGMNSIGILLAHLATAELFWVKVAPVGMKWEPDGKELIQRICGIKDDGIPLAKDGRHPSCLKGLTAEKYLAILAKSRRVIKTELKKWYDRDLDKFYQLGKKTQASRTATLHHILEHFSGHYGQILMIKHLMRDAKVLKEKKR